MGYTLKVGPKSGVSLQEAVGLVNGFILNFKMLFIVNKRFFKVTYCLTNNCI